MTSPDVTLDQCDRCVTIPAGSAHFEQRQVEAALWHEFHTTCDRLTDDEMLFPGYFDEGWTVRDVIAHVGAWLAEAGMLLEQMNAGTYVEGELDIDAANARFFELMRDIPLETVKLQAWTARWRMIGAWTQLRAPHPAADRWVAKAGAEHYTEHIPRLHEWVDELIARRGAARAPVA